MRFPGILHFLTTLVLAAATDHHSYANFEQVRVTHIDLDLSVSFAAQRLEGNAELSLAALQTANELIVDTNGLEIRSTETRAPGQSFQPAKFTLGKTDPILGSPLRISLPPGTSKVRVGYATTAQSQALNWLDAAQTAGKRMPFFYTQSWSIHARGWVPLQDSPQVKFTYSATIRTPPGLLAVMSAENDPRAARNGVFHFEMRQPIPPHGLALAVGDLAFQPLGNHTGVYADPAIADKAAREFAATERLLDAAQRLLGTYRWERYDMLLLPPGAPYGGMENPRLTFLAASALAGDQSAMSTVAHELAHSWSGNLVTNATWSDIWISEGFTSYLTGRLVESVFGRHAAEVDQWLAWQSLKGAVENLELPAQLLHPHSAGHNPDDMLGPIPYQKGALFLRTLEARAGRPRMDEFLQRYFARFAYESITTEEAVQFMTLLGLRPSAEWLDQPGIPKQATPPSIDPLRFVNQAHARWSRRQPIQISGWSAREWIRFVSLLSAKEFARADREFHLSASPSLPVTAVWLRRSLAEGYAPAAASINAFLASPPDPRAALELYTELVKTEAGRQHAEILLQTNRASYAASLAARIEQLLAKSPRP